MIGVIKAYCYDDVKTGIRFLGIASKSGCIRSSYVLGLVLRDTRKKESTEFLVRAASEGYLPALQELLPAKEMKEKYGEPSAVELGAYFDSVGLGRLLRRSYSQYPRNLNASHCWNPYCGRWAYKSEKNGGSAVIPHDSNSRNTPNPEHLGQSNPSNSPRVHEVGSSTVNSSSDSISRSYQGTNDHTMKENSSQNHTENRAMCIVINRVSRMKMCSSCRRAKYCSKLCQVYDWRSGRHKKECRRI